jgi:hypothetical protein
MTQAKKDPEPWTRLLKAARAAQDLIAAEHSTVSSGTWDSDDAMQVFEDIECAALDIEEAKVNADALPDLLAVCEAVAAMRDCKDAADWKDAHGRLTKMASEAVRKAK